MVIDELISKISFQISSLTPLRQANSALDQLQRRMAHVMRVGGPFERALTGNIGGAAFWLTRGVMNLAGSFRNAAIGAGLLKAGIGASAVAFGYFVTKVAAARRELQIFGRANRTTPGNVETMEGTFRALGVPADQAKSGIAAIAGQVNDSIADGKGGKLDWGKKFGISTIGDNGVRRDPAVIFDEAARSYLARHLRAEGLRKSESDAKLALTSEQNPTKRAALLRRQRGAAGEANKLEVQNTELAKGAGFTQELIGTLRGLKSMGDYIGAQIQAKQDRPGRTAIDEANFAKLARAMDDATTKAGTLAEAMASSAAPAITTFMNGVNGFLDDMIAKGKYLGLVRNTPFDEEQRRAQNRAANSVNDRARQDPATMRAASAAQQLKEQGYGGSILSQLLPSAKDLLVTAFERWGKAQELVQKAATDPAAGPDGLKQAAEILKSAGEELKKAYAEVERQGPNKSGRNTIEQIGDLIRKIDEPNQGAIQSIIKMLGSEAARRPDITNSGNDQRTFGSITIHQTVTGATAPGAAASAVRGAQNALGPTAAKLGSTTGAPNGL
ncbi:MAG TPA: hypothetical protein VGU72_25570 [Beijerinckiaceae bacterium]|jgi:hypothetical protein|nr:hypothetical protein [Beijerinckiaceae bacterium]